MRFSAVLLAGGKSSRMGCDKAFLQIDGVPLWQRQLNVLNELAPDKIFIAGRPCEEWCDYEILPDASEDAGPLAGLTSAFRACATSLLLTLAVDLPKITGSFLRNLLSEESGIVPQLSGRFEPLVAIYPKSALPIAESHLSRGEFSMQKFVQECIAQRLVRPIKISPRNAGLFTNLNTPEDMDRLRAPRDDKDVVGHVSRRGAVRRKNGILAA
jgi:molybdenum cofactor guanylyltransferase